MGTDKLPTKDLWDKLDIFVKLFSSLVLAAIALIIQNSANEISSSIQKAQLLNDLINGLSTKKLEEAGKRDLSLIALDYTFGQEQSSLVPMVAERVYQNIEPFDDEATKTAVTIITKYKGRLWVEQLRKERLRIINKTSAKNQEKNTSDPRASVDASKIAAKQSSPEKAENFARLIESEFDNIVYIQYRSNSLYDSAKNLRKELQKATFNAPGIQQVNEQFSNEIRYFHNEDKDLAIRVKTLTDQFFAHQTPTRTFKLVALTGTKFKAPKGQVEIWIQ